MYEHWWGFFPGNTGDAKTHSHGRCEVHLHSDRVAQFYLAPRTTRYMYTPIKPHLKIAQCIKSFFYVFKITKAVTLFYFYDKQLYKTILISV